MEASVQYKPPHATPSGLAWENESVVPVAEVDYAGQCDGDLAAESGGDYGRLLSLLVVGAEDAETVGRRTLFLAFLLKADGAPANLADLGRVLGISKQAASAALTRFKRFLPDIARQVGFQG